MQGRTRKGTFAKRRFDRRRHSNAHNKGTCPCRIAVGTTRRTFALYRRALILHKLVFPYKGRQPSEACLSRALADYCDWLKARCTAHGIDWRAALEADEKHEEHAPEADAKRVADRPLMRASRNVDDRRKI